jgi:hypothetical protein
MPRGGHGVQGIATLLLAHLQAHRLALRHISNAAESLALLYDLPRRK